VSTADVAALHQAGTLDATTDFSVLRELDTVNICVPTPLRKTKDPDMSYVVRRGRADCQIPASGHARRARVDDVSGDDGGTAAADVRGDGTEGR
jgi:hypothetical protein